jgi:hypothetical protein
LLHYGELQNPMPAYAKFTTYQLVRLKHDRPAVSEHPFTGLEHPRAVTTKDTGVIVEIYEVPMLGYEVEFFDADGYTLDLLTLTEDEIEAWE